jgi:hypothetical protein
MPSESPRIDAQILVRLQFFPSERLVASVARLVADFCRATLDDVETTSRFHLATYELVENLVKYSSGKSASVEVELEERERTLRTLTVRARNKTTPEQLEEVKQRLGALQSADDPVVYYDQLIAEAAPRSGGSGLGLARIRAEGDLELDFAIEGDELTISARASIAGRASQ